MCRPAVCTTGVSVPQARFIELLAGLPLDVLRLGHSCPPPAFALAGHIWLVPRTAIDPKVHAPDPAIPRRDLIEDCSYFDVPAVRHAGYACPLTSIVFLAARMPKVPRLPEEPTTSPTAV